MANNNGHWPPNLHFQPSSTPVPSPHSYPLSGSINNHPFETDEAMTENFSVQYSQANSGKSLPASPHAEENVVSHSHDKSISFQEFDEYALVNRTIGFHGQEATFGSMQKSFLRVERPMSSRQRCNEPNGCVPPQFSSLPDDDDTTRGLLSTRNPLFVTHCKEVFSNEPDFSLIDQCVAGNNQALGNILSSLERCDAAHLEKFYRSAFEGLDPGACAAILNQWMKALSLEALVGIQNTHSRELTYPDMRDVLYYILRGNYGVKISFKRLLDALHFVGIETTNRKNVEARLLLREIEIWTELYQ